MGNYDISSETRELKIQRSKVLLGCMPEGGQKQNCRRPLARLNLARGAILGKEIYATRNLKNDVEGGKKKTNRARKQVSRKIFRNKETKPKIRILLWESLIRSTLIYGLHTKDISRQWINKVESYIYKYPRVMVNLDRR